MRIYDESRTNTAVLDPTTGLHTEINERGPAVSAQEMDLFREKLLYLAQGASICVFAGSLPRGVDNDIYQSLIRDVRSVGATTIIDSDGEPLRMSMRAEPDLVSPNELEAEEFVGHEFNDSDDRAQAVLEMARQGAHEAIMTVADGCYARIVDEGSPTHLPSAGRRAGRPLGSWLRRRLPRRIGRCTLRAARSPVDCLRFGVACGAESTHHFGAGIIDPGRVERLLSEVNAERVELGAEIG